MPETLHESKQKEKNGEMRGGEVVGYDLGVNTVQDGAMLLSSYSLGSSHR